MQTGDGEARIGLARWAGPLGLFLIAVVWLAVVWRANTDLTEGRFALFMDEGKIFDGIWDILHPAEPKAFARAVISGGDQTYGRILWNVTTVTSFIPEKLWGETGLIIAERMTQALLYLFAGIMLSLTFVRRWYFRLLLIGLLLVVPFVDYYTTTPKPEPVELALIAIFLWLHKARDYRFGPHWLFLGMAFGAKIAVLPLAAVLIFHATLQYKDRREITLDRVTDCGAFFLAGFGLAVPLMLVPVVIALGVIYLARRFAPNLWVAAKLVIMTVALGAGCFLGKHSVNLWLDGTFRQTTHGRDEARINLFSWIDYFFHDWLGGPVLLNIAVVASVCLVVVLTVWRKRQAKEWSKDPGLLLIGGGLAMIGAIFISSHRLWGFYLMPGMVLALVGAMCLIEEHLRGHLENGIPGRAAALAALVSCTVLGVFIWVPKQERNLQSLAQRTADPVYRKEYATYRTVISAMTSYAGSLGRPISVMFDPQLFMPNDTQQYKITRFWGPYGAWTAPADLLVFGATHLPGGEVTPSDSPEYPAFRAERSAYDRYVIDRGSACHQTQCYERIVRLPNGGEILARRAGTL